ncbi:MAG: permease-like cell division protein FtsX [Steroidobacteraceae bacterium]
MSAIGTWGARHAQALLGSVGRLSRAPLATVLTVMVVGLALALPLSLRLLVDNTRAATGDLANAVDVTVYFKADVSLERAEQLRRNAGKRSGVAAVSLLPAEQALEEFREYSGFGEALEALESNPLPHVLNVRPAPDASAPAQIEQLKRYFAAWPEVDIVQVDTEWVQRFAAILEVLRRLLLVAAIVLGVGVLAVIGNTIRLEIQHRRPEIEVTKLVGGSNAFVRRPFLYTGALYGLAGALLAWLLLAGALAFLSGPVDELARLYGSRFSLRTPAAREVLQLLGAGTLLGWLAAWGSTARHLARIQPRA